MTLCADTGIDYDRSGPYGGTTVVLLHAGVADRRMWEPQWTSLTGEHDVVRLDLRGFGGSVARPEEPFAHHEDVAQTLSSLGVDRAHLVGCSLGAGVAVEVALARPQLVASLLLATPGGSLIAAMTAELRRFVDAENEAMRRGDVDAAVAANLDWWVDGPHRAADEERSEVRALVAVMQRRAFELTADWDDVEEVELAPPAVDRLGDSTSRPWCSPGAWTSMPSASRGRLLRPGSPARGGRCGRTRRTFPRSNALMTSGRCSTGGSLTSGEPPVADLVLGERLAAGWLSPADAPGGIIDR